MNEVCSEDMHVKGVALLALGQGFGVLVAGAIGGILADPVTTLGVRMSFLQEFPYLLPSITTALFTLIITFCVYISFDETLIKRDSAEMALTTINVRDLL